MAFWQNTFHTSSAEGYDSFSSWFITTFLISALIIKVLDFNSLNTYAFSTANVWEMR